MGVIQKVIAKGRGRKFVDKSNPLGPLIHELQDVVDAHDVIVNSATSGNTALKAQVYMRTFHFSFETGEVGTVNLFFPSAVTITRARVCVTKALAGTDAGTIQLADNGGVNMTAGLLTVPLSSAIGTDVTVVPTTGNVVVAGNKVQVTTAKTTAGGKGSLTLEYTYN